MSVTINDVARLANVSKAAVSYVINNKSGVSQATRERILAVMTELNYRPNPNARGLAGQSTGMIGMAIPDISDMFYARIIRGVEKEVNTYDYILNLCTTHGRPAREKEIVELLSVGRVDGLLLMAYSLEEQQLQGLIKRGIPFVLVNCPPAQYQKEHPAVFIDHYYGALIGIEYLIQQGHKRIGIILGPDDSEDSNERFNGYKQALQRAGLSLVPEYITRGDFQREGGYNATQQLLSLSNPPSAVFATNDWMALGTLDACRVAGLSVPRDLSVLGFDDIEAADYVRPRLSTLRQPTEIMGVTAVQMLFDSLERAHRSHFVTSLKPELIIRESIQRNVD